MKQIALFLAFFPFILSTHTKNYCSHFIGLNKLCIDLAWLQPVCACWEIVAGGGLVGLTECSVVFSLWQHLALCSVQKCSRRKLQIVTATQDGGGSVEFWYKHSFKEAFILKRKGCKKDVYCIYPKSDMTP